MFKDEFKHCGRGGRRLLRRQKYQKVPELKKAMELLETGKFKKLVAFSYSA